MVKKNPIKTFFIINAVFFILNCLSLIFVSFSFFQSQKKKSYQGFFSPISSEMYTGSNHKNDRSHKNFDLSLSSLASRASSFSSSTSNLTLASNSSSIHKSFDSKDFKQSLFQSNLCSLPSERNTIQIFSQIAPLVAFIHSIEFKTNLFSFFSGEEVFIKKSGGSGIVWNEEYVVTNYHVIAKANEIFVTLKGNNYRTSIIGTEPRKDLAVLRVASPVPFKITFSNRMADSSKVLVGQKALAIGNPFGLDHTLTVGVISALGRSIPSPDGVTIRDMIQTDAPINPGNSGGPLLDSCGRLVGINTSIFSQTGQSADIGFAVPSNTIKRIVPQIIKHGRVIQPGIGVNILSGSVAKFLRISGLVIQSVRPHFPAEKAGLRGLSYDKSQFIEMDIITQVDDVKIKDYDDYYNALEGKRVGDIVNLLLVRRRGKKYTEEKIKMRLVDVSDY